MASSFARRITLLTAVADVMGELGLSVPGSVAANTEKTVLQFFRLTKKVGQQLAMGDFKWQILNAEFTITTVIGTPNYALPTDFDGFISDSSWNRTTRLPVIGALKEHEWQMLEARLLAGTTFTMLYIIENDFVVFYNTPTAAQTIVMPYTSRGWCKSATGDRQDELRADADVILFDPQLFKTGLRLAWYEAKQFDTTKFEKEYRRVLAAAKANDVPGRTLSLAGRSEYPYLGSINVPDTGYGA